MADQTWHIPTPHTERLVLRAPKLADAAALEAFFTTDRSRFIGGPLDARSCNRAMMAVFGNWALHGFGLWYIADRATDARLGWTGLFFAPGWEAPELGWTLMAGSEGHGIAYEAALKARSYAAQHLGHDGVISYIDPANARSIALAERMSATSERSTELAGKTVTVYRHPHLVTQNGGLS